MLTVEDIALRLSVSTRTAWRRVATWYVLRDSRPVPRVELRRVARTGRPRYLVDEDSFARWLCPEAA